MPTYMEVEDRGRANHEKVAYAASGFSTEHARKGKLKFGIQGSANRDAPPGPTYYTSIPVKKALKRRSAAFREFNLELKELLGRDYNRVCYLDGISTEITVIYYNRP